MDPQRQFCPNWDCPARGQAGQGTIRVHSQKERRYRCTVCGRTFAATRGTPFYRAGTTKASPSNRRVNRHRHRAT